MENKRGKSTKLHPHTSIHTSAMLENDSSVCLVWLAFCSWQERFTHEDHTVSYFPKRQKHIQPLHEYIQGHFSLKLFILYAAFSFVCIIYIVTVSQAHSDHEWETHMRRWEVSQYQENTDILYKHFAFSLSFCFKWSRHFLVCSVDEGNQTNLKNTIAKHKARLQLKFSKVKRTFNLSILTV